MPRTCTVCAHPERAAIDKALVADAPNRRIATKHGVSEAAIRRHKAEHLPAALVQAHEAEATADALDVLAELRRCLARVNLLFDACDRWLRDPDDPARYDIGPRAHDIMVTYEEPGPRGTPIRRKAALSTLLARLDEGGVAAVRWETKHADPRELVLKTAGQLQGHLELLAKLVGQLDERPVVNLLVAPEWVALRSRMVVALAPFPEARLALAAALEEGGHDDH